MDAAIQYDGSLYLRQLAKELETRAQYTSSSTVITALLLIVLAYQLLPRPDYSVPELLWNFAIYATPTRFLHALEAKFVPPSMVQARQSTEPSEPMTHTLKSQTVRRMLGLDSSGILGRFQRAKNLPTVGTMLQSTSSQKPPGLGNWDNSCYQNSVIQGLASLPSFGAFLDGAPPGHPTSSTRAALKDIIEKLKDHSNLGAMFWTPAQLKSMSSWQQQDAQEYFSKLMDEVDKEYIQKSSGRASHAGLAALQTPTLGWAESAAAGVSGIKELQSSTPKQNQALRRLPDEFCSVIARNPLEGLLAQRVGCLKCGYVEGLSLIPFNCLTLPLGKQWLYDIRSCLDDYTTLEPIDGVDCAKCTLLQGKTQLEKLRDRFPDDSGRGLQSSASLVSKTLTASVEERLNAVTEALDNQDFSDNTVLKKCQISQKARVFSTKTRQAVIARAPKTLAIHINRSVFNERTGVLSKNHAHVRFPLRFSLAPWCLGGRLTDAESGEISERWNINPAESMLGDDDLDEADNDSQTYELRAALTHYGRHENGHYICYRRHEPETEVPSGTGKNEVSSWWRFSDEDVSAVSQDDVLAQGDVFMLFYERIVAPPPRLESRTLPLDQEVSDLTGIGQASDNNDSTRLDIDADERLTVPSCKEVVEAQDEGKDIYTLVPSLDASPEEAVDPRTTNAEASPENMVTAVPSLQDRANDTDELPRIPTIPPVLEPDQTTTKNPETTLSSATITSSDATAHFEEQSKNPLQDFHPPLLPPSQNPHTDTRNISQTMRTATPRSGRGSISRGQKGMGQVSSMVASH
ncbi:MAG: hypothetical protein Q9172_000148 [Xanthocarpia lactea]